MYNYDKYRNDAMIHILHMLTFYVLFHVQLFDGKKLEKHYAFYAGRYPFSTIWVVHARIDTDTGPNPVEHMYSC